MVRSTLQQGWETTHHHKSRKCKKPTKQTDVKQALLHTIWNIQPCEPRLNQHHHLPTRLTHGQTPSHLGQSSVIQNMIFVTKICKYFCKTLMASLWIGQPWRANTLFNTPKRWIEIPSYYGKKSSSTGTKSHWTQNGGQGKRSQTTWEYLGSTKGKKLRIQRCQGAQLWFSTGELDQDWSKREETN